MTTLKQTATELLLYVPFAERDRAKKIEGRRWDPDRRCWIYKRTRRALDEILREFGDELDVTSDLSALPSTSGHHAPARAPIAAPARDADRASSEQCANNDVAPLAARIEELEKAAQEASSYIERNELELVAARDRVRVLESRLVDLTIAGSTPGDGTAGETAGEALLIERRRVRELESTLASLRSEEADRRRSDSDMLATARAEVQSEIAQRDRRIEELENHLLMGNTAPSLDEALSKVMRALFPANADTAAFENVATNEDLAVSIGRRLELDLRTALQDSDRTPFRELIDRAGDLNVLSQEAIDLAHLIRKQRNRLIHPLSLGPRPDAEHVLARNLLAISAVQLVLGELNARQNTGAGK